MWEEAGQAPTSEAVNLLENPMSAKAGRTSTQWGTVRVFAPWMLTFHLLQSFIPEPGSSLVKVCQRSIFLSLFLRQSNQCFSLSPFALIPSETPPRDNRVVRLKGLILLLQELEISKTAALQFHSCLLYHVTHTDLRLICHPDILFSFSTLILSEGFFHSNI